MSIWEQRVVVARTRLTVDRWIARATFGLAIAAGLFTTVVAIDRSFGFSLPVKWIGLALLAATLLGATVATLVRRVTRDEAAVRLDEAAGLRERLSTAGYCTSSSEPFEQAVVADAENTARAITVARHIRFSVPRSLGAAASTCVLAALMFLISPGWLRRTDAEAKSTQGEIQQTKAIVQQRMDKVRQMVENTPALQDLKDDLKAKDDSPAAQLERPEFIRHEAVKKIDQLADAIKQKRDDDKYDAANDLRKLLRPLQPPKEFDAPTEQLAKSLAKGDLKTAQEEIKKLQEQLATLKSEEDKEMVKKIGSQLEELAKQIDKLTENKQLQAQLEQAGIKPEDAQRMLENLKKDDLEQLKKQMEEKGFSQQQMQKLANQLQQQQQAGSLAKKLAEALNQAGQCKNGQQTAESQAGLSSAGQQLSQMQQLEQEGAQLDAAMSELQNAREGMDSSGDSQSGQQSSQSSTGQQQSGGQNQPGPGNQPGDGQGSGDGKGEGENQKGSGGGMGQQPGQGRGGLAPQQPTDVGFKTERQKVHVGKGAIVGQVLFEGEQVKGDVNPSVVQIVTAAEREASDLVNRDRVPRQYQKSVRDYFSNVRRAVAGAKSGAAKDGGSAPDAKNADDSGEGGSSDDAAGSKPGAADAPPSTEPK